MAIWIIISWYVVGVSGALVASKYDSSYKEEQFISRGDLLTSLTLGGLLGVSMLCLGISFFFKNHPTISEWLDKKAF
jgi:hypothetical protein